MGDDDDLIPVFVPALVALLLNRERHKGDPLTRDEVFAIRDNANCVMLRQPQVASMAAGRGYDDLDPEMCWEQWQIARLGLGQPPIASPTTSRTGLLALLGAPISGSEVAALVDEAAEGPRITIFDERSYFEFKGLGLSLLVEPPEVHIAAVHVYCQPTGDDMAHQGALPLGLSPSLARAEVRALLGPPSGSGLEASWDRYDFADHSVHVEYAPGDNVLALLTLTLAGEVAA